MERKAKGFWIAALVLFVLGMVVGLLGMILLYASENDLAVESGTLALMGVLLYIGAFVMHLLAYYKRIPYLEVGAVSCAFIAQVLWLATGWMAINVHQPYLVVFFTALIGDVAIGMAVPYAVLSIIAKVRGQRGGVTPQERARIRELRTIRNLAAAYAKLALYYETGRISLEEYLLRKEVFAKRYGMTEEEVKSKFGSAASDGQKQEDIFDFGGSPSQPKADGTFRFGDTEITVKGESFEITFDGQTVKSGSAETQRGKDGTELILTDQNGKKKIYLVKEEALESEEGVRYLRK